jgi:hypothetical protein
MSNSIQHTELLDSVSYFEDGLGLRVPPAELWRVGLSRQTLRPIKNLYRARTELEKSCFRLLDIDSSYLPGFDDVCELLEKGKNWIIEPLRELQPRSYAILAEAQTELLAGFRAYRSKGPPGPDGNFPRLLSLLYVRDRAILLEQYYPGWSPEEGRTPIPHTPGDYPEFLLKSWWYRLADWKLARSIPGPAMDRAQPLLQRPVYGTGINDILAGLGPKLKRKYMPMYKERFGAESITKKYSTGRVALLCIIDTRPPETNHTPTGDQLFLNRGCNDTRVYHVHCGQFDQLRALRESTVVEAFDRYFEHVLSRQHGEFDFLPYSELV